jgi:hypothetical protein
LDRGLHDVDHYANDLLRPPPRLVCHTGNGGRPRRPGRQGLHPAARRPSRRDASRWRRQ